MPVDRYLQSYEHIPTLIKEVDKLYVRITEKYPEKTKLALTVSKILEHRGWKPALPLIKDNLHLISQLGISFIPKIMKPGPCFLFPLSDFGKEPTYAQVKPLLGSCIGLKSKYHFMGIKTGRPDWMGATRETLQLIMKSRKVVIVEGVFDYLACHLLCPGVPVLSPLTKKLGDKHVAYLRMLGVKTIYLMYDNEVSGAGNRSMEIECKKLSEWFTMNMLLCPASDPSDCLKSMTVAGKLKRMLSTVGNRVQTDLIDLD